MTNFECFWVAYQIQKKLYEFLLNWTFVEVMDMIFCNGITKKTKLFV